MIDLTGVQSFSDQDILNVLRASLVSSVIAKESTINGRTLSMHSAAEIQGLIREYEWRLYRSQNGFFVAAASRPDE